MKIAVCLSGHLRKFEQTFPTLHVYLLQNYDCDVFISTWDKMGYGCRYKTDQRLEATSYHFPQVKQLFKPKKMVVEDSNFVEELIRQGNDYAPHLRNEPKHVGHMASMFYKIYAANELRKRHELESGTKYDWVIRCRPDLLFSRQILLPAITGDKKIFLPRAYSNPGWFTDQFAIAQPADMDLYSSFFFHMPEYFKARNEFYPEKFMDWSLRKMGLTPEMIDINYVIQR